VQATLRKINPSSQISNTSSSSQSSELQQNVDTASQNAKSIQLPVHPSTIKMRSPLNSANTTLSQSRPIVPPDSELRRHVDSTLRKIRPLQPTMVLSTTGTNSVQYASRSSISLRPQMPGISARPPPPAADAELRRHVESTLMQVRSPPPVSLRPLSPQVNISSSIPRPLNTSQPQLRPLVPITSSQQVNRPKNPPDRHLESDGVKRVRVHSWKPKAIPKDSDVSDQMLKNTRPAKKKQVIEWKQHSSIQNVHPESNVPMGLLTYLSGIASDDDNLPIGRWGEAFVYHYLQREGLSVFKDLKETGMREGQSIRVTWVNEAKEAGHSYDVVVDLFDDNISEELPQKRVFIEVKATKSSNKNVFHITMNELIFAMKKGENFHIYRIYNAGTSKVRLLRLINPIQLLAQRDVALAMFLISK